MIASLLLLPALALSSSEGAPPPLPIGAIAPDLSLKDVRYLPRKLSEFGKKSAYVLVFITRECPLAKRYIPRVAALEKEFRARDVQFAFVNAGAGESIVESATQMVENGIEFPLLKDFDLKAANALGVSRTPEAVVLDSNFVLRYRGRVDDQMRLSGVRPEPQREDLRIALEELLAGKDVAIPETEAEGCALTADAPVKPAPEFTFAADVAPIVYGKCVPCHREKGEAPFPLVSFEQVKKRIDMIDEVVREERMPPWYGSADYGVFANHLGLTRPERAILRSWIAAGANPGDLSAAPKPPAPSLSSADRWRIGKPDLVLEQLGAQELPATGYVPYQYVVMPHLFLEDTYVEALEIQGDNKPVLHHANLAFFEIGKKYEQENFITGFVPGGDPMDLGPGLAVKIPKGSVLGLQVHYVTSGKPENCHISVALRFPHAPVTKLLHHAQIADHRFTIPPFAQGHPVEGKKRFDSPITCIGMFAHMHLRGRDMMFKALLPGGADQTLLIVPNYNFDWQQSYHCPKDSLRFPAGTTIDVLAHFDNSRFNPFNPDPSKPVRFGLQTEEEMMYGFFFYTLDDETLDLRVDPRTGQL